MVENWDRIRRRSRDVAKRASTPNPDSRYCRVVGCKNPTRAGSGRGLNQLYCRVHEDHYQRHGSPFRGSYGREWLNPYRRAAFDWLTEHADDRWVKDALVKMGAVYQKAGPFVEAFRLRGQKPEARARAAWARLRKARIDPRMPIAAWIAIEMITRDDPQAVRTTEYKRVQAAKIIHRMVSGTHKRWERQLSDGKVAVEALHKFPMSRGLVLRHIGEVIERVAELVVDKHLGPIKLFMVEREKAGKLAKRAQRAKIENDPNQRPQTLAGVQPRANSEPELRAVNEPDKNRKRPYSIKLPDGTIVEYK